LRDPLVTTTEEIIVLSFSQQQIAHFRALGFVVLPGLLDDSPSLIADDPRLFQGAGDPR
jgi:hypothetical protein